MHRQQPSGQGPAHRRAARPGQPVAHRPGHRRHGRFRQRHGACRATASTRPATRCPRFVGGPRFGAAYDVTGKQKFVVRGSAGLYFDRPDGNTVFGTVANPPTATSLTQQWGRLSDLANSQFAFGPVPTIVVIQYDSAIPKDFQWNLGVQIALPWASSIDVSYVGHHAFDVLADTQNQNGVNLNAIDVGTTLTSAGQDPDAGAGHGAQQQPAASVPRLPNINVQMPIWNRTFHSLQLSWQRAGSATGSRSRSTTPGRSTIRATQAAGAAASADPWRRRLVLGEPRSGDRRRALRRPGHADAHHRRQRHLGPAGRPEEQQVHDGRRRGLNDWQLSGIFRRRLRRAV